MRLTCESVSNEINNNDSQREKHSGPRNSTFRGIVIDLREDRENAPHSIRLSRESRSNETDASDRQYEKHEGKRISTVRGILIDSKKQL
jgi:hypothetical protein